MRVLLRADAGVIQGSGHVMRCLTLAEELVARGHDVVFLGAIRGIDWLVAHLDECGIPIVDVAPDSLELADALALQPDWVVVDSYRIDAAAIASLNEHVDVLAVVDGDVRGIQARLLLDQNLGAEEDHADVAGMLAGARYALVRREIVRARRPDPAVMHTPPRVLAFMGGTDPFGVIVPVVAKLALVPTDFDLTVIAPSRLHDDVRTALDGRIAHILSPTPELPRLLGEADVVVSAAGTSAWDVCTLCVPAVLLAVVDNQVASLRQVVGRGLALAIDFVDAPGDIDRLPQEIASLLTDGPLRSRLSQRCAAEFDGDGAGRVVRAMEAAARLSR